MAVVQKTGWYMRMTNDYEKTNTFIHIASKESDKMISFDIPKERSGMGPDGPINECYYESIKINKNKIDSSKQDSPFTYIKINDKRICYFNNGDVLSYDNYPIPIMQYKNIVVC